MIVCLYGRIGEQRIIWIELEIRSPIMKQLMLRTTEDANGGMMNRNKFLSHLDRLVASLILGIGRIMIGVGVLHLTELHLRDLPTTAVIIPRGSGMTSVDQMLILRVEFMNMVEVLMEATILHQNNIRTMGSTMPRSPILLFFQVLIWEVLMEATILHHHNIVAMGSTMARVAPLHFTEVHIREILMEATILHHNNIIAMGGTMADVALLHLMKVVIQKVPM